MKEKSILSVAFCGTLFVYFEREKDKRMVHRPDPTDLSPIKFVLFGVTNDNKNFSTGFWTRDFSLGSPPVVGDGTAFINALKPLIAPLITFTGCGWKTKAGTVFNSIPFTVPVIGTAVIAAGTVSNSATFGYGGVAIDNTGAARNIRCISHVPRGWVDVTDTGIKAYDRTNSAVATFLNWFASLHPTDNFGRPMALYSVMNLQNNAVYQERSGF